MLSRTADHLYWMARYMERAENTARMLDINLSTLLLSHSAQQDERAYRAQLRISELEPAFDAKYDAATRDNVLDFMVCDEDNPSSILRCLFAARENARAVRGSITTESWETINLTWLEARQRLNKATLRQDPGSAFEWVKFRSHLSRGVTLGTAMRDDSFLFTRLGTFLERADNTARILDVRLLEAEFGEARPASGQLEDYYYWASILSSVSALEIYRKVYRDVVIPEKVVELLMLNPSMPRSLLGALDAVCDTLKQIESSGSLECERFAGKLRADLAYTDIPEILENGLHAYLTQFLERVYELGNRIAHTFLLPAA